MFLSFAIFKFVPMIVSFGPGGLFAPCMLACAMHSLAIVITLVQSLFFSFFSSVFCLSTTSGKLLLLMVSVRSRPPGPPAVPEVFFKQIVRCAIWLLIIVSLLWYFERCVHDCFFSLIKLWGVKFDVLIIVSLLWYLDRCIHNFSFL